MLTTRTRNALLLIGLFAAWAGLLSAFPSDLAEPGELLGLAAFATWAGGLNALPVLLAAWASLADQPLFTRLPNSLGLLAGYGLCAAWSMSDLAQGEALTGVLALFGTAFTASLCMLLLVRRKWSIKLAAQRQTERAVQFTVRRALMWTLAIGLLFGVARMILPDWPPQLPTASWQSLFFYPLLVSIFGSAMLLPAIGLVLARRHRLRSRIGLLVLYGGVAAAYAASFIWLLASGLAPETVVYSLGNLIGFTTAAFGTLWVCRMIGCRLKSSTPVS